MRSRSNEGAAAAGPARRSAGEPAGPEAGRLGRARDGILGRATATLGGLLRGRPRPPPVVPAGLRIYAVGDIHGRADCLARVFAAIDADTRRHPAEATLEIYLGDYVDRGPDSRTVIDLIIDRSARRRVVPLLGNHEAMLLGALAPEGSADAPVDAPSHRSALSHGFALSHRFALSHIWRRSGAAETLASYGLPVAGLPSPEDWRVLVAAFRRSLPPAHRGFLERCRPSIACGSYFFAHAGIRPGIPIEAQDRADLFWIREPFLTSQADHGAVVVHGHTPVREPELRANRINLDTGAYLTGHLGCVALEGSAQHVLCG